MKTKIQIDDRFGIKLSIKKKVEKIVNILFENSEISENYALFGLDFNCISFDIVFCDDNQIQEINREYRKKDSPTDVITFALFADDENKFVFNKTIELGEIIISIETAKRQAAEVLNRQPSANGIVKLSKKELEKEILTLICHGILHLLGFDHQTDTDYNFVVGIQNSVISKVYEEVSIKKFF